MTRQSLVELAENFRCRNDIAYLQWRGYRRVPWSYPAIAETASQFARELERRGIGKGDAVMLWGANCAEWVVAFLGCVLRGAVVVPMDDIAANDFARRVSQQVAAKLVVTSRAHARAVETPFLVLETLAEELHSLSGAAYPGADLTPADTLQIVFTSGTTADPKGVVISHGNVLANLEPLEKEIGKYLKYEKVFHPIRFLNLLPLSHVFGQFLGIFLPQSMGAMVVFLENLNPSEILRTIKDERISVLVTVPRVLQSLQEKIQRDLEAEGKWQKFERALQRAASEGWVRRWWRFRKIHDRLGWKFWAFISGGAALPPATEEFWRRLSFVVIQGYGLTETTSLVSVNHPFHTGKGSIGKVLPGREIKLDPSGEILVRGENLATRYWQGRELRPVAGEQGWFHTGDRGELDAAGNLYFRGRVKDVIVTPEGMKVHPEDLEKALRNQPEVKEPVVIGLERDGNAVPCAVLLMRDAMSAEDAARSAARNAVERANQNLADFQRIRQWMVWPESDFPRTSTQKPRIPLITAEAEKHFGGTRAPAQVGPTAGGQLQSLIARVAGPNSGRGADNSSSARLDDLDSIGRVELLSALEDRYEIDLDEQRFAAATTIADLERMLSQPRPASARYQYPRWAQRWPITWVRPAVYYMLVWPATRLLGWPAVMGRENLRGVRGPVLFVCNHVTFVDIGFILAALPARFRHRLAVAMIGERLMAMRRGGTGKNFFSRTINRIAYALAVALFNVFPLPQIAGFRESFHFAGESADRGQSVLVFPEGRRTTDGTLSPFRAGIGMLATKLNLPVVPLRIDGLFELKQAGKRIAAPGAVKVRIGSPVRFSDAKAAEEIARELQSQVQSL